MGRKPFHNRQPADCETGILPVCRRLRNEYTRASMQALTVFGIIIEIVILFNFIILVHELGHYLAARWRGLKVDKFQIWFGKPIWSKTINGVQWGIGSIPAGGFVALPQMNPMEMLEGEGTSQEKLPKIKPIDKIIVAAAGPIFSLLLAGAFAILVWGVGHPVSTSNITTKIGYVSPEAVEGADQLQPGDVVLEVDGKPVDSWSGMVDSVAWNVISSEGDRIPFKVQRPGEPEPIEVSLVPPPLAWDTGEEEPEGMAAKTGAYMSDFFTRPELRRVERMGIVPEAQLMVGKLFPNSPAEKAGLKPNDIIVKANGQQVTSTVMISDLIKANSDEPINLEIERDGQPLQVSLTPELPKNAEEAGVDKPMLGIRWDEQGVTVLKHTPPLEQIQDSVETMYNTLSAVFSPSSSISAKHLSGPVGIMRLYYRLFEHKDGWRLALWFSVVLNINLAILNLLPLPVLDGGHITMAVIEAVRRRPLSKRLLDVAYGGCAIFLIGFMLFITGFDVTDWFGGDGRRASGDMVAPEEPVF